MASGWRATVGGGYVNTASGSHSTVAGGIDNTASGDWAAVGGGTGNVASGFASTVAGGANNTASGVGSIAAGSTASANHDGAIVFADQNDIAFNSTTTNEFAARATGGVRFVSAIDGAGNPTAGVGLAPGGGSWSALSDRAAKANFALVDGRDILDKLAAIPIETWNYNSQPSSIRHIGPIAQDFYAAFGVGEDDRRITTIDADGVALAAIQGLNEILREKDAQIAQLEARIAAVESSMGESGAQDGPRSSAALAVLLFGGLFVVSGIAATRRPRKGGQR